MNEVVDYMRSLGNFVLVAEESGYCVNERFVTARQLLLKANRERMRRGLRLFPTDLADPTHKRRTACRGSLTLVINAP